MKRKLLTIGILALGYSVEAQNGVLLHVDEAAKVYVSSGALVYNGGGLQTRGTGIIDLHGNMMIEGSGTDVVRTITTTGGNNATGGNIVLRLNDPSSFDTSSYGQLYIDGISQANLTATVNKEFRTKTNGSATGSYFQQVALPFSGKALSSLSTEFGKTFGTQRYTQNEVLKFNNLLVVSDHYTDLAVATTDPTGYYMLGSRNGNLNTETPPAGFATIAPTPAGSVYTLKGTPYAALSSPVTLSNAGNGVNFGSGGSAINKYNERYNTYLQDMFDFPSTPWSGTYGKNMYQFGNPFFTNLDLSRIGYAESATGDGNDVSNILGVRYDPGTVMTLSNGSTYSTGAKVQTFTTSGTPVGDVGLIIKPMQTFLIKLRDNTSQTLNFNTLRRFNSAIRAEGDSYSVTAKRINNLAARNTVKQLGIIALDVSGKEVSRTYYVVSAASKTGHQDNSDTSVQAQNSGTVIGTYEEAPTGGYDDKYKSSYWLYINEANEVDFLGKNVKLMNYDYGVNNAAVSYKFEIRENAELTPTGSNVLSSGVGFYYKEPNGAPKQITQNSVVPITAKSYDLYYGAPSATALDTRDAELDPSRTRVVYNPLIEDYIVRFDPNWKKADIQVYDMSGKLVISENAVNTTSDYVIKLDNLIRNSYIVKIVSDNGEIVNSKIIK